jgi:elongation factor G
MTLAGQRVSGLFRLTGSSNSKIAKAGLGDIVALGRLEKSITGQIVSASGEVEVSWPANQQPLFALSISSEKKADDVKLSSALQKLIEEDNSLLIEHNSETNELVLWGQGEIHLQIAADRLKSKFGLDIITHKPLVPYKETIRKGTTQHARHKRQSGGHGQFADIHVEINPLPRGAGFVFTDRIVGGVVPKQYIPAVEEGAREFTVRGPLGFPVVDLAVTLTDGTFHAVDSSDMAFKMAARLAMSEGLPQCEPVLLEPILHVELAVPTEHTSKAQRLLSSRRGQILGFDAKPGWNGWDIVAANLPQAEMQDMIVELRSLTMGVGTFGWKFDHLQELSGKPAEKVVEERKKMLEEQR